MQIRIAILLLFFQVSVQAFAQHISIDEKKYVTIGGIEHWVTIRGDNINNPAILFIHGGPGSVMSPFNNIYREWEKEFVLINWDQRGAGRTFGKNAPDEIDESYWKENELTIDQMVKDGLELTEYLTDYLKKQKVVLIATSWGSILGTKMALIQPDLYYAYLGHAQFVDFSVNLKFAYNKVLELTKESADTSSFHQLSILGEPPYKDARNLGQMLRIVKKYEMEHSIPAPDDWWEIAPDYDNETDTKNRYNGDDYSFLYFAGHEQLGVNSMAADVNFNRDGHEFKIPVYLIQGENDLLTASEINKPYFDKISAPDKEYYFLPNTGHGHNKSVVDAQYQILKEKVFLNL